MQLQTERLVLRQFRDDDLEAFARLNADAEAMQFFPNPLSRKQSDQMAANIRRSIAEKGWGLWALELEATGAFIGFTGLREVPSNLPFAPAVEIGWRLAREFWGKGYATEAAREALRFAFEGLELDEVVAFTSVLNRPSVAVMRRIGMTDTERNFLHPAVNAKNELAEHVLFHITAADWRSKVASP